jgi:site-specific recombinase XerD
MQPKPLPRHSLPPRSKLLHQLRVQLRLGHFSRRTEEAYVSWVRRFVRHAGLRHPREMGEREVVAFLVYLAVDRKLAAATVAQSIAALQFLYRHVLDRPLPGLGRIPKAQPPARIPTVLSEEAVKLVLGALSGTP